MCKYVTDIRTWQQTDSCEMSCSDGGKYKNCVLLECDIMKVKGSMFSWNICTHLPSYMVSHNLDEVILTEVHVSAPSSRT
jgi:pantothenate kinase